MSQSINLVIPDLGDFADVEVIELLVSVGDMVVREDGLITVESDKASLDIPSPENGVIEALTVAAGDKVSAGDVIGKLSIEVGDTVVITPAIAAVPTGDTTVQVTTAREAPRSGGMQTLVVPDLGGFSDVEVIEVHIAAGDEVNVEDPLVTLETEKAAMDVPVVVAGRIESVLVQGGDKVSEGSSLALIDAIARVVKPMAEVPTEAVKEAVVRSAPAVALQQQVAPQPVALPLINESGFSRAHASPSVRKLARELGVDLMQVKGAGRKARVLHSDVKAFVKAILTGGDETPGAGGLPRTPRIDFARFGKIETQPLTRIQKISAPRLQASWINLPHVTQHDLADITGLEAKRQTLKGPAKERGISLTPLAFIMKACVAALGEYPRLNASLSDDGESVVYKKYYHLGFAADTDQGLMVPVIRDADKKNIYELASELAELSSLARAGKLKTPQLQGASFTISSLGGIGGTAFTPIVNAPEVGILGVSRSAMQPVWNGSEFAPRLMLPLALSYDHRVVDGAYAVRFTTCLCQALANVDGLLEASA